MTLSHVVFRAACCEVSSGPELKLCAMGPPCLRGSWPAVFEASWIAKHSGMGAEKAQDFLKAPLVARVAMVGAWQSLEGLGRIRL